MMPVLVQIEDVGSQQQIKIEKRGFPDAVLWNPWVAKSKGMSDFGDKEYKVNHLQWQRPCPPGCIWGVIALFS